MLRPLYIRDRKFSAESSHLGAKRTRIEAARTSKFGRNRPNQASDAYGRLPTGTEVEAIVAVVPKRTFRFDRPSRGYSPGTVPAAPTVPTVYRMAPSASNGTNACTSALKRSRSGSVSWLTKLLVVDL